MRIAKEGYPYIIAMAVVSVLMSGVSKTLSRLSLAAAAFCAYFFRDPERDLVVNENAVVCPADGTVIEVLDCEENEYINGPAKKISIFMSVFNVHINRAPIAGTVDFIKYKEGRFDAAFNPRASFDNEMNLVGIQNGERKVLVKQIAGVLARRIVCDMSCGDMIGQSERFGMIKFGSRVEVFIPKSDKLKVNVVVMDKVTSGETVLAEYCE